MGYRGCVGQEGKSHCFGVDRSAALREIRSIFGFTCRSVSVRDWAYRARAAIQQAMDRRLASAALLSGLLGCVSDVSAIVPNAPLVDASGAVVDARSLSRSARLTVFVFFSAHCRCVDAHDARLRALEGGYGPQGVQFIMVDSEVTATVENDAAEGRRRGYRFPFVVDRSAKLARAVGAASAAYVVVSDAEGRVQYRGGIDSDRVSLHEDATFFLRDALDDLLAGRPPRVREGKALGCALAE
jgi:hypothetical protein